MTKKHPVDRIAWVGHVDDEEWMKLQLGKSMTNDSVRANTDQMKMNCVCDKRRSGCEYNCLGAK